MRSFLCECYGSHNTERTCFYDFMSQPQHSQQLSSFSLFQHQEKKTSKMHRLDFDFGTRSLQTCHCIVLVGWHCKPGNDKSWFLHFCKSVAKHCGRAINAFSFNCGSKFKPYSGLRQSTSPICPNCQWYLVTWAQVSKATRHDASHIISE